MGRLQAFMLTFVVLSIQTIILIIFGIKQGISWSAPTCMLFMAVDICLAATADILKIVKGE